MFYFFIENKFQVYVLFHKLKMPSTRKNPISTSKKKKPASDKPKNKKSATKRTGRSKEVSGAADGSYLHDVSQVTSKADELLDVHSLEEGSEAILNTLKCLEESNRQLVARIDRIEGNSTVSSTPKLPGAVTGRENVTFRLPKPKSSSPVKSTMGELTPRANLINSYKWPAREEMVNLGGYSTEAGNLQVVSGGNRVTEQRQGYRRDAITPTVDRLRSIPEVSNVVANLLADYEARVQQEDIPCKPLSARRKSGRYNITDTPNVRPEGRWPNEGFVAAANSRKPAYDDLSLQQWAAGQLSNVLQIQDDFLCDKSSLR